MKRGLFGFIVVVIVIGVLGLVTANFFIGSIIKKGVETVGPTVTKTDVKLDGASLALLSGSGELRGLLVGNPQGFKTPSAIRIGSVSVQVVPRSVFGGKVIVHSVKVLAPEITFEGGLQGNNLSKLLDNIRGTNQPAGSSSSSSSSRTLEVDDLLITGGKINVNLNLLGSRSATVALPEIHLTDLGQDPNGLTPAELSEKLVHVLLDSATRAVTSEMGALGKNLGGAAQAVGTGAVQQVEKVTKGLGSLFKKP
jgi:hypothetical protein